MRTLLASLLNPLPLLFILIVVACFFYYRRNKPWAKGTLAIGLVWLFIISTPFIPRLLLSSLEQHYQVLSQPKTEAIQQPVNILVLGSGYQFQQDLSNTQMLHPSGLARLAEAIRISQILPETSLIFSGYNGRQPWPQAEIGAGAATELGINPNIIYTIPEPWNTRDEARRYKERYCIADSFILITDAAHMPRAMYHFKKAGLNPIPAPCNLRIKKNDIPKTLSYYLPSSQNITYTEILFHEYLGLLWAKLGGD